MTYITVEPIKNDVANYIKTLETEILNDGTSNLWVFGKSTETIEEKNISNKITLFNSIQNLTDYL